MVRIEVGYGLEGKLTDLLSGPDHPRDHYSRASRRGASTTGFEQAIDAIIATVKGEYKGTGQLPGQKASSKSVLPFLLVALFIAGAIGSRRRIIGGIAGAVLTPLASLLSLPAGWLTLALVPLGFGGGLLAALLFASRRAGRGGRGGIWPGGFGGFGGGGGFSGGGGGFSGGGGGFGGGGASGRW